MQLLLALWFGTLFSTAAHASALTLINQMTSPYAQEVFRAASAIEKHSPANAVMAYSVGYARPDADPGVRTLGDYGFRLQQALAADRPQLGDAEGWHVGVLAAWRAEFAMSELRGTAFLKRNPPLLAAMLKGVERGNLCVFWASRPRDRAKGAYAYGIYDTVAMELMYIVEIDR